MTGGEVFNTFLAVVLIWFFAKMFFEGFRYEAIRMLCAAILMIAVLNALMGAMQ